MECPVDGLHARKSIRCRDFVESQHYVFARKTDGLTTQTCCFCCSEEEIMTTEKITDKVDCGGSYPLHLCKCCLGHSATPLLVNKSTKFVKKSKEVIAKRKRQANWAEASGCRKGRSMKK